MRLTRGGVVSVALVGGLLAFLAWSWQPPPEPAPQAVAKLQAPPVPERARPERPKAKVHKVARKALPREAEPVVPPQEKARIRSDFREERLLELDEQLDAYAEEAGWDPGLTEEVRGLLVESMTHIGRQLARVDEGRADWAALRPALREYRLERAAELQALLGDEFDPFMEGMAFGRFLGERPPGRERFDPYKR